jgi:ubiquinone/menaquinone biosynthesis C-methylase UbiE
MPSLTSRVIVSLALVSLCLARGLAQQTALTNEQLKSAEIEVPRLVQVQELKPGMTVADLGAGFGAWTMALPRWLGPAGRVYASDIGADQLTALHESVQRERLNNVTVVEAGVNTTNLPSLGCDAILTRDPYHHFTSPDDIAKSIAASLFLLLFRKS